MTVEEHLEELRGEKKRRELLEKAPGVKSRRGKLVASAVGEFVLT